MIRKNDKITNRSDDACSDSAGIDRLVMGEYVNIMLIHQISDILRTRRCVHARTKPVRLRCSVLCVHASLLGQSILPPTPARTTVRNVDLRPACRECIRLPPFTKDLCKHPRAGQTGSALK